jgi:uncharacterized peroxidase-related enzyme
MPHIALEEGIPGIRSLVQFRPVTGVPLYDLAQVLLRGPSPLSPADRELIATYVSYRNNCFFCFNSHAAAARCLYGDESSIVNEVISDKQRSGLSEKMKALLTIAGKVQISGKAVNIEDITAAKTLGATDREIHDTVLIAATFSMFNRYVDGLSSWAPDDPAVYKVMGEKMAENGYKLTPNQ